MSPETFETDALAVLRRLVGDERATFHDGQFEAIAALVQDRRRALVVQRTGWGKSAVYFVATALLRAAGAGPTVIVSPLLALMRDQIAAATRAGVRAVTINTANPTEWGEVYAALEADQVDLLLVSPERLNNPTFRDRQLPQLAARCGLLVVDEAHCISDWGHDFRPDYRRIRDLLVNLDAGVPVLATTATANARVVADVVEQLGVGGRDVLTVRGTLARASLRLGVLALPYEETRVAWLVAHLADFTGSGIIYTLTVAQAEDLAALGCRARVGDPGVRRDDVLPADRRPRPPPTVVPAPPTVIPDLIRDPCTWVAGPASGIPAFAGMTFARKGKEPATSRSSAGTAGGAAGPARGNRAVLRRRFGGNRSS